MDEPDCSDLRPVRWMFDGRDGLKELGGYLVSDEPDEFHLRGRRWTLPGVAVSDVAHTPVSISPPENGVEQRDYVSVVFVRHGVYDLYGEGGTFHFEAGSAGYMAGWNSVSASCSVKARIAMVTMHRDRLATLGVTVRDDIGGFSESGRLRRPALSFVLALMDELTAAGVTSTPPGPVSTVLAQLMAGLFIEDSGYRMDSASFSEGLRARAEALIARNSSDPDFTPPVLAETLNVSLRHLQRSFSSRGFGPAEAIRAKRLESALEAMRLASQAPRSVADIALQAGFSSVKELRYALRTTYGITPRELLAGTPLLEQPETRLSLLG
ncbi:helix-turn-helix domain-containing protein [Subtercola boreus]|uniref:HTH araC/xylS-type domain-containing protein n=1 Tax=Subtercola boreus TaxID=120213 RepID=A0A3E0WC83_9MICO|nr:helix-turn-helix domain-containing protein [Subtercola boreus]RFA20322.1 hypothetical protein B7R24_09985 [Subtercola boreus]RFA20475.1 hypothetical protein B7R23_09920 [Subtercola boreus]RFA26725.1 hypothetical protein B7R25_10050 [Subtercola boreus]